MCVSICLYDGEGKYTIVAQELGRAKDLYIWRNGKLKNLMAMITRYCLLGCL